MNLLKELLTEKKTSVKVSKTAASKVYHRDYMKTKNKKYRKHPSTKALTEYETFVKKYITESAMQGSLTSGLSTPEACQLAKSISESPHEMTYFMAAFHDADRAEADKRARELALKHIPGKMKDLPLIERIAKEVVDFLWEQSHETK